MALTRQPAFQLRCSHADLYGCLSQELLVERSGGYNSRGKHHACQESSAVPL